MEAPDWLIIVCKQIRWLVHYKMCSCLYKYLIILHKALLGKMYVFGVAAFNSTNRLQVFDHHVVHNENCTII